MNCLISQSVAVIGAPDMVLENGSLKVTDKKNQTANAFSMDVAQSDSDVDYAFWFKVENLKLMPTHMMFQSVLKRLVTSKIQMLISNIISHLNQNHITVKYIP